MNKAFTIIELLISIAIVATITALSVATFTNYNEEKQLQAAGKQLAVKIEEMRLRAFSGQKVNGAVPAAFSAAADSDFAGYSLFGDFNANCLMDGADALIEKIALPSKVAFKNADKQKVCFKTNEPLNFVCADENECASKEIIFYLETKSGKTELRVVVGPQNGMVSVVE
jgi:prepilin-type N-terminal cleavage/methylation domain-containing protein